MPDTKITALAAITTVAPANDLFPIVDVSDNSMAASGTTKNITVNQLLGAGGTATLASATITGDLTVRTNKLAVTSTGVGAGIATPLYPVHLVGEFGLEEASPAGTGSKLRLIGDATKYNFRIGKQLNVNNGFEITPSTAAGGTTFSNPVYTVTYDGIHTFLDGAGGTRMTLNSTGLGVGVSPAAALHVKKALAGTASAVTNILRLDSGGSGNTTKITLTDGVTSEGYITMTGGAFADQILGFGVQAVNQLVVNASGNVGIGVTPSAWGAGIKAFEIGAKGNATFSTANAIDGFFVVNNAYYDTAYKYGMTGYASRYTQYQGQHQFFTAPSGTAGTAITFTQAMTLDASSNLYVGTTSSYLASRINLQVTSSQPDAIYIRNSGASLSLYWRLGNVDTNNRFNIYNQSSVGVYLTDGATSWTGTSDERLKDIIEPISNAVAKVGSLRSVIGKFKTDSEGTRRSFLIAQDVQSVFPEAVDASNANELGLRYTEVIPLLVAAIKELTARVQTLETR